MNREDNPCWKCEKRHEGCQLTCREGKIASIKRELERRKKVRYFKALCHCATEGERKRAIKNLKWHGKLRTK
ncbi:MAG: hypothetical protein J6S23_01550 [Clostridia bacterium]|nr:hypothetical protein [Clostridia bacterium]